MKIINIITTLFLYNSITLRGYGGKKNFSGRINEKQDDFVNNNQCRVLKKIEHSIKEFDKIIENILIYSTSGESINTVLERLGKKKYNNSLLKFINSIKLTLYKEKIAEISESTKNLVIKPDLLGKLFSNFIFDGEFLYCKNIISIGYVILRLIGHSVFDYDDLKIFLKQLFFHLVSKGFGINSYNGTRKIIAMGLAKNLFIFLSNSILKTNIKMISSYWDFKIRKIEAIDELVDSLYYLICFHLNFLNLAHKNSITNNFLAAKQMMEKWFMINSNNFLNQDLFFRLYNLKILKKINLTIYNTDLSSIENKLTVSVNKNIKELSKFSGEEINYFSLFGGYTHNMSIFSQDWTLDLADHIETLEDKKIKFYLKPYKKFVDIFVIHSIKEEPELESKIDSPEINYVVEKKKYLINKVYIIKKKIIILKKSLKT